MTEQEAIKFLTGYLDSVVYKEKCVEAHKLAIKVLEEIQQYRAIGLTPLMIKDLIKSEKQAHKDAVHNAELLDEYRAIGTVDECRAAVEKMKPKKPIDRCMFSECPTCGNVEIQFCKHCPACGQALIW